MKVGDKVRLNNYGLEVAFGSAFGVSHMKHKVLTIVRTEYIPLDDADDVLIEVDDPELSQLMLYSSCFDKIS